MQRWWCKTVLLRTADQSFQVYCLTTCASPSLLLPSKCSTPGWCMATFCKYDCNGEVGIGRLTLLYVPKTSYYLHFILNWCTVLLYVERTSCYFHCFLFLKSVQCGSTVGWDWEIWRFDMGKWHFEEWGFQYKNTEQFSGARGNEQ